MSSGQQEEQRPVPFHRPQLPLSVGHTGWSGIQEGVVRGHTKVREALHYGGACCLKGPVRPGRPVLSSQDLLKTDLYLSWVEF